MKHDGIDSKEDVAGDRRFHQKERWIGFFSRMGSTATTKERMKCSGEGGRKLEGAVLSGRYADTQWVREVKCWSGASGRWG